MDVTGAHSAANSHMEKRLGFAFPENGFAGRATGFSRLNGHFQGMLPAARTVWYSANNF
ncbi:MAG: hypothetical protein GXY32_02330 [Ruminococcaceae bacterium]|nr:hypothetical protein [Oscillospiraceae bacterium]